MKLLQIEITEDELTYCILSHRITKAFFLHHIVGTFCFIQRGKEGDFYVWDIDNIKKLSVERKVLMLMACRELEGINVESEPSEAVESGDKED
jgi:hypothetical protein